MTFAELLDQALALLQRHGRVTYQTLQLQFQIDEAHLAALKDQLLYACPQILSHPMTLGNTLIHTAIPHQYRRETREVQEHAEATLKLANEQGFALWLASGMILRGWALAMQGQVDEGVAQMCQGLTAYRATDTQGMLPCYLAMLAEGYNSLGHTEEGLRVLDETLAVIERTGGRKEESRVYRLKGELLLRQTVSDETQAETCFQKALTVARRQQAKSLELRAATSLDRESAARTCYNGPQEVIPMTKVAKGSHLAHTNRERHSFLPCHRWCKARRG